MPTLNERIEGGLVGLLVGDALGVPYEFKRPFELPDDDAIEFEPPAGYHRSHAAVPAGTWSDDGAQALCLLESLLECGRFDADDFGRRMVAWHEHGHLAVDGRVFDVGNQTVEALWALARGQRLRQTAAEDASTNGNGALMRVLPLALWCRGSDEELFAYARQSSQLTHPHLRSQLCCGLFCLWMRRELAGESSAWEDALTRLDSLIAGEPAARGELEQHIVPNAPPEHPGSGYVVDTLRTARMLSQQSSYEQTVKAAVRLGYDTDTTAAVAGGAAGVRYGIQNIPERWRLALRGRELLEPFLRRLRAL
jgi:ADP-ribosyl-[dinitrogen reductase] hydrolase